MRLAFYHRKVVQSFHLQQWGWMFLFFHGPVIQRLLIINLVLLSSTSYANPSEKPSSHRWLAGLPHIGGQQSVRSVDKAALSHAYDGLSDDEQDLFTLGRSFFNIPWVEAPSATTARDGLGPLFNANTCISCHPGNGAGFASNENGVVHRSMVFRLSKKEEAKSPDDIKQGFVADPVYGAQLSINAVHGVLYEGIPEVNYHYQDVHYPDGEVIT